MSFASKLRSIAATLVILALPSTSHANEELRMILCDQCDSYSDLLSKVTSDVMMQRMFGNTNPAIYIVSSANRPMSLMARLTWYEEAPGFILPVVMPKVSNDTEAFLLDQILYARAAVSITDIDDLPIVTYTGGEVVTGSPAGYQTQAFLFMNGNPQIVMPSAAAAISLQQALNVVFGGVWGRVGATLAGTVPVMFVKLEFVDGSYGVFSVSADAGTIHALEVYFVEADGTVHLVRPELLDGVDDPNIDDEIDPNEDSISDATDNILSVNGGAIVAGVSLDDPNLLLFFLCQQVTCFLGEAPNQIVTVSDIP